MKQGEVNRASDRVTGVTRRVGKLFVSATYTLTERGSVKTLFC